MRPRWRIIGVAALGLAIQSTAGAAASSPPATATARSAVHSASIGNAPVSFADAIDRIRPAIVAVGLYDAGQNPAYRFFGTGFAVADGSLIATNAHVIPSGNLKAGESYAVAVPEAQGHARTVMARLVSRDDSHDLVILKMSEGRLAPLAIGRSDQVREGDLYGFTGFPIGAILGLVPATHRAMISAITPMALPEPNARALDNATVARLRHAPFDVFQLDGTAYPGNSGSPLFDAVTGEVVGIVNMSYPLAGREQMTSHPSGIAYAIPARYLKELLDHATEEAGAAR